MEVIELETKIDIISGFLGAGKTTLIRKLIAESLYKEKIVIIENEFGQTGIDGSVLKNSSIEVKEINSGCICCSMSGEFIQGIREVVKKYRPERIIIEPTGVGKLSDVVKACRELASECGVRVNMAITVADVLKYNAYLTNFSEFFRNQIKHAGTVILSRVSRADEKKLQNAVASIRSINERANIITTEWDKINGDRIIELAENAAEHTLESQIRKSVKISRPHSHGHDADEVFEVWEVQTPNKYDRKALDLILRELGNWDRYGMVLRSKGILEQPDGAWVNYDYVPGEVSMKDYSPDYSGRICVIGSKLNRAALSGLFGI